MKLIKILGSKYFRSQKKKYGIFECEVCGSTIEWQLGHGQIKKSCGCARIRHDSTKSSRICRIWRLMKFRCHEVKYHGYKRYGGRGIAVCDEWMDFYAFKKWAYNNGYEMGLTIDRIENDGNYEPRNCQFLTSYENNLKKSTTVISIEIANEIRRIYNNQSLNQKKIADLFNISKGSVSAVVCNKTWKDDNYVRKIYRTRAGTFDNKKVNNRNGDRGKNRLSQ